jgi:hypothetical protein
MTEGTSPLAGLWIGAAISNTFHLNKAGPTTAKRARVRGIDQGRRQCCHTKHKKSLSAYMGCIFTFRTRLVQKDDRVHCAQLVLCIVGFEVKNHIS